MLELICVTKGSTCVTIEGSGQHKSTWVLQPCPAQAGSTFLQAVTTTGTQRHESRTAVAQLFRPLLEAQLLRQGDQASSKP